MIDEKKIEEAAEKYTTETCTEDMSPVVKVTAEMSFAKGIDWFKENLWHDASEEPKETNKSLLCQCSNGEYITHPMKPTLGEWHERCEFVGITRWLYIEDLMKGGSNG